MGRGASSFSPDDARKAVLDYIAAHPDRPMKARSLARAIDLPGEQYTAFRGLLREMLAQGEIGLGPGKTVVPAMRSGLIEGVLRIDARGFGVVERSDESVVIIPRGKTGGALHGDTVAVRVLPGYGPRGRVRGRIVRVVHETAMRWVGELERHRGKWFVRTQGAPATPVVEVDDPGAKGAHPGDLVVVEPLRQAIHEGHIRGVIVERLGDASETLVRIRGVARRYGVPEEFPDDVRQAAQSAAALLSDAEIERRVDLRQTLTITIDPVDARDFDDAISLQEVDGGEVELGVHIADVSHFVPLGGPLDREARDRGTSVYFPGYVVPMLPEVLSNGVCSLQEGQPRLTKSAFIRYDAAGDVKATRFEETVISSAKRLTYEQVDQVLAGKKVRISREVRDLLARAEKLARAIRKRRLRAGMLVLSLPDVEIELDAKGNVRDARPASQTFSHTIIEMFMVEANEAVSRRLRELNIPHLRRVHAAPDPDAASQLMNRLQVVPCRPPKSTDRRELQALLDSVRGQPQEPAVNMLLLRSFAQAMYSPERIGHYALASRDYCHFTSPIRRYPDLTVHRLFKACVDDATGRHGRAGGIHPATRDDEALEHLAVLGTHTSAMERRAQDAERSARAMLLLDLLRPKIGEVFEAVVSGVAKAGAFVQIQPYLIDGLVPIADLGNERWRFSRISATLVGRDTGRVIAIGQPVRVRLAAIDEARQQPVFLPAARFGVPGREAEREARGRRESAGRVERPGKRGRRGRDETEDDGGRRRGRGRRGQEPPARGRRRRK